MAQGDANSGGKIEPRQMMGMLRDFSSGKIGIDDLPEAFVETMTKMMKRSKAELSEWVQRKAKREESSPKPLHCIFVPWRYERKRWGQTILKWQ